MAAKHILEELNNCSREELITMILMMQGQLDALNENIKKLIEQVRIANSYWFGKHHKDLLRGSIVTPSLLASILNVKYVNSSALHRIEQEFQRNGVNISGQTMSNWIIRCSEKYLKVFLTDVDIPIDNSASEWAIRTFCVGKENWMFHNTARGAEAQPTEAAIKQKVYPVPLSIKQNKGM